MYKAYNGELPDNLQKLFEKGNLESNYITRQKHKFRVKYRRTNVMAH